MEQSNDWLKTYQPQRIKQTALRSLGVCRPDEIGAQLRASKTLAPDLRRKVLEGLLEDVLQASLQVKELSNGDRAVTDAHQRLRAFVPKQEGVQVFQEQRDKLLESLFRVVDQINTRRDELSREDVELTNQLEQMKEFSENIEARKKLLVNRVIKLDSQAKKPGKFKKMFDEMFGGTTDFENADTHQEEQERMGRVQTAKPVANHRHSLSQSQVSIPSQPVPEPKTESSSGGGFLKSIKKIFGGSGDKEKPVAESSKGQSANGLSKSVVYGSTNDVYRTEDHGFSIVNHSGPPKPRRVESPKMGASPDSKFSFSEMPKNGKERSHIVGGAAKKPDYLNSSQPVLRQNGKG